MEITDTHKKVALVVLALGLIAAFFLWLASAPLMQLAEDEQAIQQTSLAQVAAAASACNRLEQEGDVQICDTSTFFEKTTLDGAAFALRPSGYIIFLRTGLSPSSRDGLLRHELCHISQYRRNDTLPWQLQEVECYYAQYLGEQKR